MSLRPLVLLLRYARPHRRYAYLTLAFGTCGFLLSFVYPWITGSIVDLATRSDVPALLGRRRLLQLTGMAAATAALHAAVVYGRGHFNVHLGDAIVADLRRQLFDHLQTLSMRFFTRERTGAILSRVLQDVREATTVIYAGVIVAGMDAVQLVLASVLIARINWKLTLACTAIFPIYALAFRLLNPRVRRASEQVHAQLSRLSADVAEQISGQALVKTYTAEARESRKFAEEVSRQHALVVAESHEGHLVAASGEVLVQIGTTVVLGYGGWLALKSELTPGMLTRFLGYLVVMYGPVRRFAELNATYQSSFAAMDRVLSVLAIRPSIVDAKEALEVSPRFGHVRFESVYFRYGEGEESRSRLSDGARDEKPGQERGWVLEDVTLEATPGERVALVGPSGSGKTTLLSLVPRLYDVSQGAVLVDGVDVRRYALRSLRSAIAVVQQEPFVFSGSVRHNIAYGRPGATGSEVESAARAAHAHEFVEKLPQGYDTPLGERGVNLSGGQRQRISIARAILKDPRILVLDEATSSLDAESEAVVQQALDNLMRGRTCLVIAHRLSTIRDADRIFVLSGGRVVERGKHAELLSLGGVYARLVRHQTAA